MAGWPVPRKIAYLLMRWLFGLVGLVSRRCRSAGGPVRSQWRARPSVHEPGVRARRAIQHPDLALTLTSPRVDRRRMLRWQEDERGTPAAGAHRISPLPVAHAWFAG